MGESYSSFLLALFLVVADGVPFDIFLPNKVCRAGDFGGDLSFWLLWK